MKLSISNIAWAASEDAAVYDKMKKYGYTGLEIAPTRIFETDPYEDIAAVRSWRASFGDSAGFAISSMQSIWFGRTEKLFADEAQRQVLLEYTQKAIDFANAVQCQNLVFGSPKNRVLPDRALWNQGICFFKELGDYAAQNNTKIGIEANPAIYNTNYINTTSEALALIDEVESRGFGLNLDIGTMIENKETVEVLEGKQSRISHVHISEPFLKPIVMEKKRSAFHSEIAAFLKENSYLGYVSIEMGKGATLSLIDEIMAYVKEMFG